MTAATEIDVLESRVRRVEESLRAIEQRMAAFEHAPSSEETSPVAEVSSESSLFDFALIGKSVLIVGGAYLLRALVEVGVVPQRSGVILAFVYAMAWIAVADRALARGRRTVALFDATTAALIAGPLIWEATTRFHVFAPAAGSLLTVLAAMAFLAVAFRRNDIAFAAIAAAMTTFVSIGLAVGTADVLWPAIAATIIGVAALRLRMEASITLTLAIASDFLALALLALHPSSAAIALASMAALWVVAIETRPRWPESIQTAMALIIGAGGASLLAFDGRVLPLVWSTVAVATAAIGRWLHRPQWTLQAPFWALAATIAAFIVNSRTLWLAGAFALATLALMPPEVPRARLALSGIVTLIVLAGANTLLTTPDAGVLAMERSVVLALAAVVLSLIGRVRREAAVLARIVLALAGLKLLVEDFRTGRATTIVVALAAYGIAMVVISLHRKEKR